MGRLSPKVGQNYIEISNDSSKLKNRAKHVYEFDGKRRKSAHHLLLV